MDTICFDQLKDSGYINKVAALSSDPCELALGCEKGLFFGKLKNRKFHISKEEYFRGTLISQVFEYTPHKLIISQFFRHGFILIDRQKNNLTELQNLSYITKGCTDIKPMPNFSFETFPYILTRT